MFPSPRDIILSAVVLGAVLDLALQVSGRAVVPRDDKPGLPYDSNTIASCTYWHDNDGSIPCSQIPIFYAIKLADFLYWVRAVGHLSRDRDWAAAKLSMLTLT